MSIRIKILIPMLLLPFIAGAAILISNIIQFSSYVDTTISGSIETASKMAGDEIETLKSRGSVASLYIAEDPAIINALESGDRDALLNRSKQLQTVTGVDFCTIADASGTAVARPHKPEAFGDDVTGMPSVKSALSGKGLTVIEEGVSVRMSVCSGAPVYSPQGKLLGVVCVGFRLDTNDFVDSVKTLSGSEATIFLKDERISTTIEKADGTRAVGTNAAPNVSSVVLDGKDYTGKAKILEHNALAKYTPIRGDSGKVIGMLFVGQYLDGKIDIELGFIKIGMLILLILLTLSILFTLWFVGRIVAPIGIMVNAARTLAGGDIDVDVQINTKDEMNELAGAFNGMIENTRKQAQIIKAVAGGDLTVTVEPQSDKDVINNALKTMLSTNNDAFSQIASSSDQVSAGAKQIADGSQSLAQGAAEQAAAVEQVLRTVDEVTAQSKGNAAMAEKASSLAGTIKRNVENNHEQMRRMVQSVREISESSHSINQIIKTIDDIAFQTNILALNAAVEAARAGMHGKGFAVVADEVRNLASKSAHAAKETGSLIENSMAKAESGVQIADETALSLNEIISGINENGKIVDEIARHFEEQSSAIAQINDSISQVGQVVSQNSALAQECAAASEEMSGQSELLNVLVSQFKLKDNPDKDIHALFELKEPTNPEAVAIPDTTGNWRKKY